MVSKINLHKDAVAIRVCRLIGRKNEIRYYNAVTFPQNPWQGCELYLRRCNLLGYITNNKTDFVIDVLNDSGDIIQDFAITKKGFEYLRRTLKFGIDLEQQT